MSIAGKGRSRPGFVRIIGGRWRRHRIAIPSGTGLRPTPDRVRETLFNWLTPVLPGAVCLDLYAGTGVLGFEAVSRGARTAVLVESDATAAAGLAATREALAGGDGIELMRVDAASFIASAAAGRYDIVFIDPPYAVDVDAVFAGLPRLLRPGARVYLERGRNGPWPAPAGFEWLRRGTAGAVTYGLAALRPPAAA